jgi:hypothetical protein
MMPNLLAYVIGVALGTLAERVYFNEQQRTN